LIALRLTPPVLLCMMGAQALPPEQAPRLPAMVQKLASRFGLFHLWANAAPDQLAAVVDAQAYHA